MYKFLERNKYEYDLIFADPPYNFSQEQFEKIITLIFENELISEDGMVIIEHSPHTKMEHLEHFSNNRKYGSSIFSFFEYESEENEEEEYFDNEEE